MGKGPEARDYQCVPSCVWKLESGSGSSLPAPECMSPGFCSGRRSYLPDICLTQAVP